MYIRFVVGSEADDHRDLNGVFTEARFLRDKDLLTDYEKDTLQKVYDWFNNRLPVPPYSSSNWTRDTAAWFKEQADVIEQIWHIIALLKEHNRPIRMLKSKMPGKILYEDDYQIVVAEYAKL